MAQITLSKELHGNKRLKPPADYNFLKRFPVVEVVMGEFSAAASVFPIFFIEREGGFSPIALLSLLDGQNLFVDENGYWTGLYMPAAFRRFPFSVGPGEVDGKQGPVLMIDEDSLSDDEGEKLFADEEKDEPNSPLGRALRLIAETDNSHMQTRKLIDELKEANIIRPADLTVQLNGEKHNIGGLYGVDEKLLTELSDEEFLKLRKSGALALAHIQMLSVGQIQRLVQRHNVREEAAKSGEAAPKVD